MTDDSRPVIDIVPTLQYCISRGVPPLELLARTPCGLVEHYVRAGWTPEAIYELLFGHHRVSLRPKLDRRQTRH